ncbi:hypothetical protein KP509_17G053800 [Ceratopteris richardii]|nr:hypothetical protein KP509_17G053800 [Ceratopteris richardii]
MLYGGCREAMIFSEKEQSLLGHHAAEVEPRLRRNLLRAIMEEKVLRISRGTVIGGAKLGVFTGLYCATEQYMALYRNTHDTLNVVAAGSLTAATFGLILPGSMTWRLRSAFLGSVIGATLGVPLGLLQSFLAKYSNAPEIEKETKQQVSVQEHDSVGDAIRRLEDRVSSQKSGN